MKEEKNTILVGTRINKRIIPVGANNYCFKANAGITLIALVITIIVLLILAAVSINALTGDNGIIAIAKDAAIETRGASVQEQRDLWYSELDMVEYLGGTVKTLDELLIELNTSKLLTDEEVEEIIATGKVTIGSRTIIFDGTIKTEDEMKAEYAEITTWIPIYTRAQLEKVGSGQIVSIEQENGTEYLFSYRTDIGYILKNDLDLSGSVFVQLPELTSGVFLGNNKSISNMTIDSAEDFTGFIEKNYGTISYLKIDNSFIKGSFYVGGIVGENIGTIQNCYYSGEVLSRCYTSHSLYVAGGVTGLNSGNINSCYNAATISSKISGVQAVSEFCIGGLSGYNNGSVSYCANIGLVTLTTGNGDYSDARIGGIIGKNEGKINNCSNTGAISLNGSHMYKSYTGGIAGLCSGTINGCYNTGVITSSFKYSGLPMYTGGIAGMSEIIIDCYNTALVTSSSDSSKVYAGGIAGYCKSLNNCYNISTITADYANGIAGSGTKVTNCYYLLGTTEDAKATSKTIDEIKVLTNILGNEWKNDTKNINNGYPILGWQ